MPTVEFAEQERAALARYVREAIEVDHFPLSPRLCLVRRALDKLDPPATPAGTATSKPSEPSMVMAKMRGRRRRG